MPERTLRCRNDARCATTLDIRLNRSVAGTGWWITCPTESRSWAQSDAADSRNLYKCLALIAMVATSGKGADMDMVERVARAICGASKFPPDEWQDALPEARAAISEVLSALEEPSEAVRRAFYEADGLTLSKSMGGGLHSESFRIGWGAALAQVRKEIEG